MRAMVVIGAVAAMSGVVAVVAMVAITAAPATPPAKRGGPAPAPMTGKRERGMANCPTAVAGAITRYTAVVDGVELVVTARERPAQQEIVARGRLQAAMGPWLPWERNHGGQHGGPGVIGYCPIIHDGTEITLLEVPGGVRLHVRARSKAAIAALQAVTAQRIAGNPGKAGAGRK